MPPPQNLDLIQIPILIIPTLADDLGQPDGSPPSPIVICRNADEIPSAFGSTSESDRFPAGSDTADLLEVQQSSYVLIELESGTRQLRICHTDEANACITATQPPAP